MSEMKTASILARGYYKTRNAKTAHGLIRYGQRYKIIEVVDETCSGEDAGIYLFGREIGIPIVDDIGEESEVLIIGIAPPGGALPQKWREDIKRAIEMGKDIVSGLHIYLNDDKEFACLAERYKINIWDVRKPPDNIGVAKGIKASIPVVLTVGTDSSLGKKTVAIEVYQALKGKGINAAFIATGQTGIMIGCDYGCVVDAVKSDFLPGVVEDMVLRAEDEGFDMAIVEGQGSLSHVAYGPVAMGILYGAKPDAVIMVHDPNRKVRDAFNNQPIPDVDVEMKMLMALLPKTKLAAICLVTKGMLQDEYERYKKRYRSWFNVPVGDILREDRFAFEICNRLCNMFGLG